MKIRIMGTEQECAAMVALIRQTVPDEHIRSISAWYPNKRCTYSNEGRVYWCYQDCRNLRTFRSYYDLDQTDKWLTHTIPIMEIFEMQGRQLLAKDVY